jgi:integrase
MSLSDSTLKALKPRSKPYEVADKEGMFAEVLTSGAIVFRYRYRLFGKREKVTLGSYPAMTLKQARMKHLEYRSLVEAGKSPAKEKQRMKAEDARAETFREFTELWLSESASGPDWLEVQGQWLERDIYPALGNRRLKDITPDDVLTLLDSIKARGAAHSALRVRGIIKQVFDYAIARQRTTFNPAVAIPTKIIAKPKGRERTLSEKEIRSFFSALESSNADTSNKIALHLIFMTMVRKGELRGARWQDVDFDRAEWHIPETKNGKPHIVYLSSQALALFRKLKSMAGASQWVLPSRSEPRKPIGESTLNSVLYGIEMAQLRKGEKWDSFTVHDLRRTASTILHEQGFNSDVIEKALNHTMRGVRGVYNRAQYADQRREMLQAWANLIDAMTKPDSNVAPLKLRA